MLMFLYSITTVYANDNVEHIVWNKAPIKISLPVGKERRIDFPVPIEIELTETANNNSKALQIREDGSIYWTAEHAFEPQRIIVFTTKTGYTYLMDVEARENAPDYPVVIVDDRIDKEVLKGISHKQGHLNKYNYDYVDLTRFAAKNVYAPLRLIEPLPGVVRVAVTHEELPLYKGGDLITKPMAQWRSPTIPGFYVTAVRISSNSLNSVVFDPRLLRGDWVAAATQHAVVNPVGSEGDTTTWYLVSNQPFEEAAP